MINNYHAYYASNKLQAMHPAEKMIFCLSSVCIAMLSGSLVFLSAVFVIYIILFQVFTSIKWKEIVAHLLIPFPFILFGVLAIAIDFDRTNYPHNLLNISISNNYIIVLKSGVYKSTLILSKSLTTILIISFLVATTPVTALANVLRMRGSNLFIDIILLIYRQISVISEVSSNIRIAQQSRLGYATFYKSIYCNAQLITRMFVLSFKRSNDLFNAMEARGFNGRATTLSIDYTFRIRNILIIILLILMLVSALVFTTKYQIR